MTSKTRPILIAIIALCSLVLTACDSEIVQVTRLVEVEKEITTLPSDGGEPIIREVEVTRIIEKEVEKIVEVTPTPTLIPTGGFLITALSADVAQFNPILASDDSSRFVNSFLYGGMLRTDPFTGEIVCHFCQGWEVNGQTYTFTLRDDISWSDGEPVTVDDFIYTYAALLWGVANEGLEGASLESVEKIDSITKIDERTVAVTIKSDDCSALQDLDLGWLPQHLYGPTWEIGIAEAVTLLGPFGDADDPSFAGLESNEMNRAPAVSNGPFLFDEWVPGDHITLLRNPNYFKGAPYLDGLVVRVAPDEAIRVQILRTGEINLLEDLSPRFLTEIELMEQLNVHKVLGDSYVYLGLELGDPNNPQSRWVENEDTGDMTLDETHGEHPILSDKRVRQAITYGLDRSAIINQVLIGQGVPLDANMLPSLTWAYNDGLEPRDYDPEKAAALLDEAGWILNESTGIRENGGRRLELDLLTNLSSEKRVQIGELVQGQLNELGFDISFEAVEWGAFVGLLLEQQFDMVVVSWSNLVNNPDDSLFFSSENDVPGRGFNFVSYYNPTLDELWHNAATLPGCNTADRGVLYRQIQATLYDELPYNWLYAPLKLIGVNKQLVGINPGPWDTWYNVETWYLAGE
jgi:peptide/nickel transport system substrate-binding protein